MELFKKYLVYSVSVGKGDDYIEVMNCPTLNKRLLIIINSKFIYVNQ